MFGCGMGFGVGSGLGLGMQLGGGGRFRPWIGAGGGCGAGAMVGYGVSFASVEDRIRKMGGAFADLVGRILSRVTRPGVKAMCSGRRPGPDC